MTTMHQNSIESAAMEVQSREMAARGERLRKALDVVERLTAKGMLQEERFNLVPSGKANMLPVKCSSLTCTHKG